MLDLKGTKGSVSATVPTDDSSLALGTVDTSLPKTSHNVDIAAQFADEFADGEGYSREEATRLRWKLDLRLVPLLWFNVTLGAMDKVTTATAALYGFREDTGLVGDKYSWVGSAFYVRTLATVCTSQASC